MFATAQDEFEFAFKKVMVMLCREQRIEMFVKVDLDCRRVTRARTRAHAALTCRLQRYDRIRRVSVVLRGAG